MNLLSTAERASFEDGLDSVFQTFKRPLLLYVEAQTVTISTGPNNRFSQHDQMVSNPQVTPQSYLVSGCILYGNKQPWDYAEPASRANYQQDKIRNANGIVRVKVDVSGYALMANAKQVVIDGFQFQLNSAPRPHGLLTPIRYTFTLTQVSF